MKIFELQDGRKFLYQWDQNVNLLVNDSNITYVHFYHSGDDKSYSVSVVNGLVQIPNELLIKDGQMKVYGYVGDEQYQEDINAEYTKTAFFFDIVAKPKPENFDVSTGAWKNLYQEMHELDNKMSKQLVTNERQDKRITNLENKIGKDNFAIQNIFATQQIVPNNACPYAEINEIGGMSYKSKNLFDDTVLADIGMEKVGEHEYYSNNNAKYLDKIIFTNTSQEKGSFAISAKVKYANVGISNYGLKLKIFYTDNTDTIINPNLAFDTWLSYEYITNANKTVDCIKLTYSNANIPTNIKDVQIEKDSIITGYEPYFDGIRDIKVTALTSEGANLIPYPYIDGDDKDEGGVWFEVPEDDGIVTAWGEAWDYVDFRFATIDVKPNTTYTFSGLCDDCVNLVLVANLINGNGNQITSLTSTSNITFNTAGYSAPVAKVYLAVAAKDTVLTEGTIKPMLNYGEVAAPYTLYKEDAIDTFNIPEAVQALDSYGAGLPAGYDDEPYYNYLEFVDNKVFYHQLVKIVEYDGSEDENWELTTRNTASINLEKYSNFGGICIYENKSKTPPPVYIYVHILNYGNDSTPLPVTTEEELRAWLAENPLQVVYELSEPEVTDITHLFTKDNFIEVESSGCINIVNEYNKAVNTKLTYLLKEGSI